MLVHLYSLENIEMDHNFTYIVVNVQFEFPLSNCFLNSLAVACIARNAITPRVIIN